MNPRINLEEAERKVFRFTFNDGLVDIFLGCYFLMFVIGLYLSSSLGDFWTTAVFLSFLAFVYLVLRLIRKHVIRPRLGAVKFGQRRINKLRKFTGVMLFLNIIAFILGAVAAVNFRIVPGQLMSILFGMSLLFFFSIAAYFLDFTRLYFYGFLVGLSPLVGEWLWSQGYATHHGWPITFGILAGIMILIGMIRFVSFMSENPVISESNQTLEA